MSRGINQPDRFSWNSFADPTDQNDAASFNWNVPLDTPLLDVKKIQLIRATIPQSSLQIPQYQLIFWYYRMPTGDQVPRANYLRAVRLLPPNFPWSSPGALLYNLQNSVMKFLQNGLTDLVSLLNTAASPGGDSTALNPYWAGAAAQDVSFLVLNASQVAFRGLTAGFVYANAGWNDPNVIAAQNAKTIVIPMYDGSFQPQEQVRSLTLNLRLGYACSGTSPPPYAIGNFNSQFANSNGQPYATNTVVLPDCYANISGTSVVNIYGNFTGNSGNSMTANYPHKNLLATVPMTAVLANNNYNGVGMVAYLTNVPREIYAIDVELRDDQDQPFMLADNCNVNLELQLIYDRE